MLNQREAKLQTAIVTAMHRTFSCRCVHVPNGGSRGKVEAVRLKSMGVLAGHPDLIVHGDNAVVFLIEVKDKVQVRDRDVPPHLRINTLDPNQKTVVADLRRRGFVVVVVDSVEDAIEAGRRMWLLPASRAPMPVEELTTGL